MISSERVAAVLSRHRGRHAGVSARALVREITGGDWSPTLERVLREQVTALRESGVPVCGHPRSGYYLACTPEELEESCAFLRKRALRSLRIEAQLRRISLPELLGQLSMTVEREE